MSHDLVVLSWVFIILCSVWNIQIWEWCDCGSKEGSVMTLSVLLILHFSREGLSAFLEPLQMRGVIAGWGIATYSVATIRKIWKSSPRRSPVW